MLTSLILTSFLTIVQTTSSDDSGKRSCEPSPYPQHVQSWFQDALLKIDAARGFDKDFDSKYKSPLLGDSLQAAIKKLPSMVPYSVIRRYPTRLKILFLNGLLEFGTPYAPHSRLVFTEPKKLRTNDSKPAQIDPEKEEETTDKAEKLAVIVSDDEHETVFYTLKTDSNYGMLLGFEVSPYISDRTYIVCLEFVQKLGSSGSKNNYTTSDSISPGTTEESSNFVSKSTNTTSSATSCSSSSNVSLLTQALLKKFESSISSKNILNPKISSRLSSVEELLQQEQQVIYYTPSISYIIHEDEEQRSLSDLEDSPLKSEINSPDRIFPLSFYTHS